jgi:hypothetical protein
VGKSEKEKKVVLEKKLAFFLFSPLKAAKFFEVTCYRKV